MTKVVRDPRLAAIKKQMAAGKAHIIPQQPDRLVKKLYDEIGRLRAVIARYQNRCRKLERCIRTRKVRTNRKAKRA